MRFNIFTVVIFLFISVVAAGQSFIHAKTVSPVQSVKEFIDQSLIYPPDDLKARNEGEVVYDFIVDKSGKTSGFELIKGMSDEADKEALRIIRKILWLPAQKNGNPVESTQQFSISFNIKRYQRLLKNRPTAYVQPITFVTDTSGKIFDVDDLDSHPIPLMQGKEIKISEYILKEMKYPESAKSLGIQGTVKLGLIIENDGITSNIYVINSVGGGCDNEAIRILMGIRWIPGIKDQQLVRTKSFFEVTFKINENKQKDIPNRQNAGI